MANIQLSEAEKHVTAAEAIGTSTPPFGVKEETSSVSTADDLAAALVPDHAQQIDRGLERRVIRKIDLYLIPFMWIGYGFVYYDKVRYNRTTTL